MRQLKSVFGLTLCFLLALGGMAFAGASPSGLDFSELKRIPLQDGGRIKPLDTFSRENVRIITGHETFEGRGAMDLLMDWTTHPEIWDKKDFILVENLYLRERILGIPKDQKWVSPKLLLEHEGYMAFVKLNYAKDEKKIALNPEEKESLAVYDRLRRVEGLENGEALAFIPLADPKTEKWVSLGDLQAAYKQNPKKMPEGAKAILFCFVGLLKNYDEGDATGFKTQSLNLSQMLSQLGAPGYADPGKLSLEVQYNALKPFRWAWMLHLVAALLVGASYFASKASNSKILFLSGFSLFGGALFLSLVGFVLRCVIAGRPPVSNMYESLIWVTFGMTFFALVFELIFKARIFILAGSILGWVGFVLADNVPTVLDPSIQPLEPVLRSNFWLTIHVLTITLSYAAFFLSLGIGHACLLTLWKFRGDREKLQKQTKLLYRVVQVGVVLLAAGTILGGVWANYSWGRFWGWDPKETWALIALLGYVAILHGRLAGWLRERGFVIGVVLAFLGVLMAWYGVNFILGVGLHSYGFSKGGLPYVIAFVVVELILVTAVGLKTRKI